MPRPFSRAEKTAIRAQLMQAGLKRFSAQGIRATRVDDICRDIGIAKGSFYTFFQSKEDLFMTVADEREDVHRRGMREAAKTASGTPADRLGQLFDVIMRRIETDAVLRIVRDRAEMQHLLRKLPPERLAANLEGDKAFADAFAVYLGELGVAPGADPRDLEALMTLMLTVSLQSDLIPPANYDHTVAVLRDQFVVRLLDGAPV
ncbi:MAG TPA: TetR/AcrR family transcriptional regulator [Devosiaceae bacterium]|nr:TetR/AcrR family transcriptional regulator [Devosiaceae bacterium]